MKDERKDDTYEKKKNEFQPLTKEEQVRQDKQMDLFIKIIKLTTFTMVVAVPIYIMVSSGFEHTIGSMAMLYFFVAVNVLTYKDTPKTRRRVGDPWFRIKHDILFIVLSVVCFIIYPDEQMTLFVAAMGSSFTMANHLLEQDIIEEIARNRKEL